MDWLKRALIGSVVLGLVAVIGFHVFKQQIATHVFNSFVEKNAGVDRTASLPDGLHAFMCGTGSPLADATRAGPCIGVMAGEQAFVFDVGSGSVRNLGLMGFPTTRLDAAFITHLHSDHLDSLGELLLQAWIAGARDEPLPVHGPVGIGDVVGGFNAAYRIDGGFRTAHHGEGVANPSGRGGIGQEIALPAGADSTATVYRQGDVTITAIRMSHAPVDPALGYRIDYKDRSISISGDTIYHDGFAQASENVDIMFHEALDPEMVAKIGATLAERGIATGAKIFADIPDYHATPEDAARAAQAAGADQLVYYHTIPPMPAKLLETVFLGDAPDAFDGPISISKDGMVFSLPAGSDKVTVERAF